MRTTVTIEDELFLELKKKAGEMGIPFKDAVNRAIQAGMKGFYEEEGSTSFRGLVLSMGHPPGFDIDKALGVADALADFEAARKMEQRN